jgi:signal transduction histidine kinase
VRCLLAIAALLLLTSWVLTPRLGLNSVLGLWERSLLNIGTPFERWLDRVAGLVGSEPSARSLLGAGATALASLPWASGACWEGQGVSGRVGEETAHCIEVTTTDFRMRIFVRQRPGPMLRLHAMLLVRVLAHFYRAKLGEEALAIATHLKAVHETGARVTHDIKNLLQTLEPLTAALAEDRAGRDPGRALTQLRRSLPEIARRLAVAVARLEGPAQTADRQWQPAARWWAEARARHTDARLRFLGDPAGEVPLPGELFDSTLDNLLDNALRKAAGVGAAAEGGPGVGSGVSTGVGITVELGTVAAGWRLAVTDTGAAIEPALAERLLRQPVASRSGLGVGLYQCAQLASQCGYRLALVCNEAGRVRFELAPLA